MTEDPKDKNSDNGDIEHYFRRKLLDPKDLTFDEVVEGILSEEEIEIKDGEEDPIGLSELSEEPEKPNDFERRINTPLPKSSYNQISGELDLYFENDEEYKKYLESFNSPSVVEERNELIKQYEISYQIKLRRYEKSPKQILEKIRQSIGDEDSRKQKERDHLLQKMLEQSYESREVSYERKSRRKRIDDSLMMMDDYDSHLLRWNLQKCKKSQHRRIRTGGTDRNYSLIRDSIL